VTRPRPCPEDRLRAAFAAHSTRVLAYALRHVDPQSAVTTALHHLAGVAAAAPNDIGDGRYWHMVVQEQQHGPGNQPDMTSRLESWVDQDGRLWRHDVRTTGNTQTQDYFEFAPGTYDLNYPSPDYLRTLPTDADALYDFLDAHVSGSASHEEAIFVAVGDMLRGGFAPPALRTAAIQVLERLPHVTLSVVTTDSLGRTVQQFDFVDESNRAGAVQSLSFDPATAQIVDEGTTSHGGDPLVIDGPSGRQVVSSDLDFTSAVVLAQAVDQVPADVLDRAELQH
jgi:hypothetical protein